MEMLTCTRCKLSKPPTLEFFPPHKKKKNGLDSWCRACRSTYRNEICRGKYRGVMSDEFLKHMKRSTTECAICSETGALVVDHCNATGVVRGMLCHRCNIGLGQFRDSHELLIFAAMYILDAEELAEQADKRLAEETKVLAEYDRYPR